MTLPDLADWWIDTVLFLPFKLAKGRNALIRFLGLCVGIVWFLVIAVVQIPLLWLAACSLAWDEMK